MYINSNMTPREAFKFYGKLPDDWIESLIEDQEMLYDLNGVSSYIEDALAQYPDEDFIESEGIFDDLREIASNVRGENKSRILAVIEKLEALQLSISRQTEYGAEELRKALATIEFNEV